MKPTGKGGNEMVATCNRAAKAITLLALAVLLVSAPAAAAMASDDPDRLTFTLQPYMWLPTLEGNLKYTTLPNGSSGSPAIEIEPDDLLENLDLALLLTASVRKGKWSFVADCTYLELAASDSAVRSVDFGGNVVTTSLDIGADVEMKGFVTTLVAGYRVFDEEILKADLVAGARYLWLEMDTEWNLAAAVSGPGAGQTFARRGRMTEDGDVWNGVVGIRGRIMLGKSHWFIPYYADLGAGDCELTWQVFSALAYAFDSWDIAVGYRHLEFDADDDDALIQELRFSGPVIGATFRF
jgi:hypothetical protein